MTERWQRISETFEAALEQPAGEREGFVRARLAGDESAITEALSLLASHGKAEGFLGNDAASVLLAQALAPALEGQRVGAWTVVEVLGEGGMGVVYRVERADGGFQQSGALKLIRTSLPSEELVRRFSRERQILASLDHPNIARLLDGGSTASGMPYLVMEFIAGQPLYEYCSDRHVTLEGRIELFLTVCSAVQYAHQRLVLHRDIKPGNLLITSDGVPKLLDFGISRVLGASDEGENWNTRVAMIPMTPEYASPEQLRGEPLGVASDVYSLGVVLYELLTGARPYPSTANAQEQLERVSERDPERPSTAVPPAAAAIAAAPAIGSADATDRSTGGRRRLPLPPGGAPQALRRQLAGDIDNVVLRALHKDPTRRYATAAELADDLRRFLGGYPVHARPDTWSYRARRFVRRNRVAVGAGAIALIALVGGLGASLWQASVAREQRAVAERHANEVRALANSLLFELHDALAEVPGATRARELLLTRGEEYLEKVWKERTKDPGLRHDLADAYERLGRIQGQMWEANAGHGNLAYASMTRSLELREGLLREAPNDLPRVADALQTLSTIGNFEIDHAMANQALAHQVRAIELNRHLIALAPDTLRFRQSLPRREHNLGRAFCAAGRDSEGFAMMRASSRDFEAVVAASPKDTLERILLSQQLYGYAKQLLQEPGSSTGEIQAPIRRSMGIQEALLRAGRSDPPLRRLYAGNLHLLAEVASTRLAEPDSAVSYEEQAVGILKGEMDRDPGNRSLELSHATARINLGNLLAQAHQPDRAIAILNEELTQFHSFARSDTANAEFGGSIAETNSGLGDAWRARAEDEAHAHRSGAASWSRARSYYTIANETLAYWTMRGDAWSADSARHADVRFALAACDSALRALGTHP